MAKAQASSTEAESSTDTTTEEASEDQTTTPTTPPAESSTGQTDTEQSNQDENQDDSDDGTQDVFPRSYVEKLRRESQRYREQASHATEYAERLHIELVRATGRLADPEDLPFDQAHLEDSDALNSALEDLLKRKPHLASRRPIGDIGQGATGKGAPVDLAGMLRARA